MSAFSTRAILPILHFGTAPPSAPLHTPPPNRPAGNQGGFPDMRHKNSLEAGNQDGFPDKGQNFETKGNKETTFTRFIRHLDENSIILKRTGQFSSFIRRHSAGRDGLRGRK